MTDVNTNFSSVSDVSGASEKYKSEASQTSYEWGFQKL